VAPQINYGALANIRPLSFGQNPLQFAKATPFDVGQTKPYIAEGIGKAIESIGAGITAQYRRQDAQKELAIKQAQFDRQQTAKEADDVKRRESEKIRAEAEKLRAAASEAKERANSVRATQQEPIDIPLGQGSGPAAAKAPEGALGGVPPIDYGPIESGSGEPEAKGLASYRNAGNERLRRAELQLGVGGLPAPEVDLFAGGSPPLQLAAPRSAFNPMQPVGVQQRLLPLPKDSSPITVGQLVGSPAPAGTAPVPQMTTAEQEAAAKEEAGLLARMQAPEISAPVPAQKPQKEELPKLGTPAGEKDKSLVEAVENPPPPPALGDLGEPLLQANEQTPKGALAKVPSIQEINPNDFRYQFGNRPDLAGQQAFEFNKKYPFAPVQAEVKEMKHGSSPSTYRVEYVPVMDKRRDEIRKIEEHAASQGLKQERVDLSKEAKVKSMATSYQSNPTSKLMDVRKDAMQRMLTAVKHDKHVRQHPSEGSLAAIHQEMMDIFAQFASGKAPTEAQFHETKHAFAGLNDFQSIAKKIQFWRSGATLDPRDVNTMQDLMLNTYNSSASQINSQLATIESILKSENPNILPMKMPVKYPLLKTREFLQEELGGKDLDQAVREYSKLRGEYFNEATGQFKKEMPQEERAQFLKLKPIVDDYIELKNRGNIPSNEEDLRKPKKEKFGSLEYYKVPGFHPDYFGGIPDSMLPGFSKMAGQHWQGQGE
jgi:hypothetical protein